MLYKRQFAQTTIAISRKNHENLLMMGRKGQTFDDILSELLMAKVSDNQGQQESENE